MQEKEYWCKLNKNTLICHGIIVFVLIISYIVEVLKGNRTLVYTFLFSFICAAPLFIEYVLYKRKPEDRTIKKWFVIGYAAFYTFNMFTASSVMNYVYILPMASVLLCYCDIGLIFILFGYALLVNLLIISFQLGDFLPYLTMFSSAEHITSWEIQIACLILTGIFLYLSTKLIIDRTNVISELMDDLYEDSLTGCKNVRFYEEVIKGRFQYNVCERLSIGFIDIDDFKHFNTEYGHTFGDKVLREIGTVLLRATGDINNTFVLRMGGDEFIIISKALKSDTFEELCEKIREQVERTTVECNTDTSSVNITIGVSHKEKDKQCKDLYSLYRLADDRNQRAKEQGKNCICYTD